jgi:hypothetical protein
MHLFVSMQAAEVEIPEERVVEAFLAMTRGKVRSKGSACVHHMRVHKH